MCRCFVTSCWLSLGDGAVQWDGEACSVAKTHLSRHDRRLRTVAHVHHSPPCNHHVKPRISYLQLLRFGPIITTTGTFIFCRGLHVYPDGPLNPDRDPSKMCEMFRTFHILLYKIRCVPIATMLHWCCLKNFCTTSITTSAKLIALKFPIELFLFAIINFLRLSETNLTNSRCWRIGFFCT